MTYLSSSELSARWHISPRRIILLARDGRIPGAKKLGKSWIFPEDAKKPEDGRLKEEKLKEKAADQRPFRFPIYSNSPAESFFPPLTDSELRIREVELLFAECRFDEASEALGDLPDADPDIYIRIIGLYYRCFLCALDINRHRLNESIAALRKLLLKDFPYNREMRFVLQALDSFLGANQFLLKEFSVSPNYHCHPSAVPYMMCASTLALCTKMTKGPLDTDLSIYELCVNDLENRGFFYEAQAMHFYLSDVYFFKGDNEAVKAHLKAGLRLGEKHRLLFTPAAYYTYNDNIYETFRQEFSPEFREEIINCGKDIRRRYNTLIRQMKTDDFFTIITSNEYPYFAYASQELTNREVAALLHVSESTVAKRYSMLYEKYGLKNKAELRARYSDAYNCSYFEKGD